MKGATTAIVMLQSRLNVVIETMSAPSIPPITTAAHCDRCQHADHPALRYCRAERQQNPVNGHAENDLRRQQPEVKRLQPHTAHVDAAEGEKEHQEDERRSNHSAAGRFQRRDRPAEHRPDHHTERHRNGAEVMRMREGHLSPTAPGLWPKCPCRRPVRQAASRQRP